MSSQLEQFVFDFGDDTYKPTPQGISQEEHTEFFLGLVTRFHEKQSRLSFRRLVQALFEPYRDSNAVYYWEPTRTPWQPTREAYLIVKSIMIALVRTNDEKHILDFIRGIYETNLTYNFGCFYQIWKKHSVERDMRLVEKVIQTEQCLSLPSLHRSDTLQQSLVSCGLE